MTLEILDKLQERADNTTRISAPYSDVRFHAEPQRKSLIIADEEYVLTEDGYDTILKEVKVPKGYAKRMPVVLLEDNVNFWLRQRAEDDMFSALINPETKKIRSFMNPDYEYVPTVDVFREVANQMGTDWNLHDVEITDSLVKVAFTTDRQSGVAVGDVSDAGLALVHSDSWVVAPRFDSFLLRLVCTNGQTRPVTGRKFRVSGNDRESILEQVGQFTEIAVDQLEQMIRGYELLRHNRVENASRIISRICQENKLPSKVREALILAQSSPNFLATLDEDAMSTMFGIVNLLTWVATHNLEVSEGHRNHLREIAGQISATGDTRCDSCGSAVE